MACAGSRYLEATGGKPLSDFFDVGGGGTEAFPKLLGSEPLVIGGGIDVLLMFKETLKRGFLFGAALEDHQHAAEGEIRGRLAMIELRASERLHIVGKGHPDCIIHQLGDKRRWSGRISKLLCSEELTGTSGTQ
jgi:hypothetical protein